MKSILLLFLSMLFFNSYSQTTIRGEVNNDANEAVAGLVVQIKESKEGTVTDESGQFSISTNQPLPFTLTITGIGYVSINQEVTSFSDNLMFTIKDQNNDLQQIVISASRVPEKLFESPVSIEQMTPKDIANTTSPSFYDGLENLKGVDVNTGSLTFKSVNTRGFATLANERFVQLVDGMDNSSPALNFALGNLLGMNELDVDRIEILPGASSALYGANAFNGILFMTSKSPFTHQGVSAYVKGGIMSQEFGSSSGYSDFGVRLAHGFSDKVAAKVSFSLLNGTEWRAENYNDFSTGAQNRTDPAYDGLNIYGDEVSTTLNWDAIAGTPAGTFGSSLVSRTGYQENELMDYDAQSLKADVALHIRPNADDLEIILNSKIGRGNTIYQGANRYYINNFTNYQNKIEVKNDQFFVRGYLTTEDAGDSYDSRFAAINTNRSWKSDPMWFQQYAQTYLGALTGQIPGVAPGDPNLAHSLARQQAETGRLIPGTAEFNSTFNSITEDPSLLTGAKFVDNTKLIHFDGNYNFSELIDFADIQLGGSYRQYRLNSGGTIFTDLDGVIPYDEFGIYTQLQKRFADEKVKFTGSLRYDKAQNFEGKFSPRLSMVYSVDEDKDHNIRASFQTGFRNPTTQDQYIGLDAGRAILVGSAPDNLDRYMTKPLDVSEEGEMFTGGAQTVTLSGRRAYDNSFTLASVGQLAQTGNPAVLEQALPRLVQPERVTAYELGYRGALGKQTFVDISGYYNSYKDFISEETVIVPYYGNTDLSDGGLAAAAIGNGDFQPFQAYTNSDVDIDSKGINFGINSSIFNGYDVGFSYSWADFDFDQAQQPGFQAAFNTPEHRLKAQFGKEDITENVGFNLNWRWNDEYLWESSFVNANVSSRSVFDAQVSYDIDKIDTTIKIGGSNIFNNSYESVPGGGTIGGLYFVGLTYNN